PRIDYTSGTLRDTAATPNYLISINTTLTDDASPKIINVERQLTNDATNYFLTLMIRFTERMDLPSVTNTGWQQSDSDPDLSDGGQGGDYINANSIEGYGTFTNDANFKANAGGNTVLGNHSTNPSYVYIRFGGNVSQAGRISAAPTSVLNGTFSPDLNLYDLFGNQIFDTGYPVIETTNWLTLGYSAPLFDVPCLTADTDIDGQIDRLQTPFDQNVQVYDPLGAADGLNCITAGIYTLSNADYNTPIASPVNNLTLILTESGSPDTDATPNPVYDNAVTTKIIAVNGRIEMPDNETETTNDNSPPVIVTVEFGIDDPAIGFDPSPYYADDNTVQDPGAGPWNFDMHPGNSRLPSDRTYHNTIRFQFSEPVNFNPVNNIDPQGAYTFGPARRSTAAMGNFTISGPNVVVAGLGTIQNCNIQVTTDCNFMQRQDSENLFIHVAGWYDTGNAEYPGQILNNAVPTVPTMISGDNFITAANPNITDQSASSLTLVALSSNIPITFSKEWDVQSPLFRYIPGTAGYIGDPTGAGSDLSCGITSGTPYINRLEFAMSEAIRDIPAGAIPAGLFQIRFYDDALQPSDVQFDTRVERAGDFINDYNGVPQIDANINDQGFSLTFTPNSSWGINSRVAWTYSGGAGGVYLTDLRGNRLRNILTERISLESAPPFIIETRAMAGSNQMFVEFNDSVKTDVPGNLIVPGDFNYTSSSGTVDIVPGTGITAIDATRRNYIFTLTENLTEDYIVNDTINARNNEVMDPLGNYMNSSQIYPVSKIGINFFQNVIMEDSIHKGGSWRIEKFDCSQNITPEGITVRASLNVPTYSDLIPSLYYDSFSTKKNAKFWLPTNNTDALVVYGVNIGGNIWEFKIPNSGNKLKNSRILSIVFKIGRLYSYRATKLSPRYAETYMVNIKKIKFQNNSVTILNNVINPHSNGCTKLMYTMDKSGPVSIVVYDLNSDAVKVLKSGSETAGMHTISWNGKNENGKIVARGVYFIRIRAPGIFNQIRKVLVIN
ncbi:MAG: hypothetical protein JXB50_09615, partial [Spirochaetes bacterium]|nr:hypothetical protein [Spirochaetota bacterium]